MEINATIIIQAIHFSVAYFVLKKMLFVPAVQYVLSERKKEKNVRDTMQASRAQVQKLREHVTEIWRESQQELVQLIPPVHEAEIFVFKKLKPALVAPRIDTAHEKELENKLVRSIIAAVNHVR